MHRKKFLAILLTFFALPLAHAKFKQQVTVCLDVAENQAPLQFRAGFESSDVFDKGHATSPMNSGHKCTEHVYQYGPKNIYLGVTASGQHADIKATNILIGSSCANFAKNSALNLISLYSGHTRTRHHHEAWSFSIRSLPPQPPYQALFELTCYHTGY